MWTEDKPFSLRTAGNAFGNPRAVRDSKTPGPACSVKGTVLGFPFKRNLTLGAWLGVILRQVRFALRGRTEESTRRVLRPALRARSLSLPRLIPLSCGMVNPIAQSFTFLV